MIKIKIKVSIYPAAICQVTFKIGKGIMEQRPIHDELEYLLQPFIGQIGICVNHKNKKIVSSGLKLGGG